LATRGNHGDPLPYIPHCVLVGGTVTVIIIGIIEAVFCSEEQARKGK